MVGKYRKMEMKTDMIEVISYWAKFQHTEPHNATLQLPMPHLHISNIFHHHSFFSPGLLDDFPIFFYVGLK